MARSLWTLIFLLLNAAIGMAKASAEEPKIVYCIGNHDATGACWKEGSEDKQKLGCLITSWPIVECESIAENEEQQVRFECLALQNTGIVNQIALSCQAQTNNAPEEEIDSLEQTIPQSTPKPETANTPAPDAANQATVLESDQKSPNALQPGVENTTFGVQQPQDFKDAF